jgi:hypothetical protein
MVLDMVLPETAGGPFYDMRKRLQTLAFVNRKSAPRSLPNSRFMHLNAKRLRAFAENAVSQRLQSGSLNYQFAVKETPSSFSGNSGTGTFIHLS